MTGDLMIVDTYKEDSRRPAGLHEQSTSSEHSHASGTFVFPDFIFHPEGSSIHH